jgi:hypothetical protein
MYYKFDIQTKMPILKEGSHSYEVKQVEGQEESLDMYVTKRKAAL